jgi:hypothetical protein
MKDRGGVCGARWRGPPIEPGIEDGFDRAIGPGADLDGALGGGLDPRRAERADEPHYAETGAIALLGMGPSLEDLFAQGRGRRADRAGVLPDALDRPAGVAPVTGRHVLGNGRVLPIPACAQMNGDALAFVEGAALEMGSSAHSLQGDCQESCVRGRLRHHA